MVMFTSIIFPSSDIKETSNISLSLFLSSTFFVTFSWGEVSIDEIGIKVLECFVFKRLSWLDLRPIVMPQYLQVLSFFTDSFLISVHPSLICLAILRLYFELLLQPLIGQWYLFVSGLYCGSEVDDLLVTGACLISCLLRFSIKVNLSLYATSRH